MPGQGNYTDLGTTQLLSVPYAIQSRQTRSIVLPFDTTVISNNKAAFSIKNISVGSFPAISAESIKGYGIQGTSDSSFGVYGFSKRSKTAGVFGSNGTNGGYGVHGSAGFLNSSGIGVYGNGTASIGVKGESTSQTGVLGISLHQNGVNGTSTNGIGVIGNSLNSNAVYGHSENDHGIVGLSSKSGKAGVVGSGAYNGTIGVLAEGTTNATGLIAKNTSNGLAAEIEGRLRIHGTGQAPGAGKVLTSDANGNATWQAAKGAAVAFRASGLVNNVDKSVPSDTWHKVYFYQEARYNEGNAYNAVSAQFTVPYDGVFHLNTQVMWTFPAGIGFLRLMLLRNGQISELAGTLDGTIDSYSYITSRVSMDIRLLQGDIVWVETRHSSGSNSKSISQKGFETWFTGHVVARF